MENIDDELLLKCQDNKFEFIKYEPDSDEIICQKSEIDKIYKDVILLNEISSELNLLLQKQNSHINNIEETIDLTQITMDKTQTELNSIYLYQKSQTITVLSISAGVTLFGGIGALYGLSSLLIGATGILGGFVGNSIVKAI